MPFTPLSQLQRETKPQLPESGTGALPPKEQALESPEIPQPSEQVTPTPAAQEPIAPTAQPTATGIEQFSQKEINLIKYMNEEGFDNKVIEQKIIELRELPLKKFSSEEQERIKSRLSEKGLRVSDIPEDQREQTIANLAKEKGFLERLPSVTEAINALPEDPITKSRREAAEKGETGLLEQAGATITGFGKGLGKGVAGAVTGIPQATGEVADFVARGVELAVSPIDTIKALAKGDLDSLPQRGLITEGTRKFADKMGEFSDFLQESIGLDPDDAAVKLGEMFSPTLGEVAALAKLKKGATAISKAEQVAEETQKTVGKITQVKKRDIPKVQKALSDIDTTNIKTFEDLKNAPTERIKEASAVQDELLEAQGGIFKPEDVSKKTKVGEEIVEEDFVNKALDDLNETYTKSNEAVNAERIRQLKDKFNEKGLSPKEINSVAREYGTEFKQRSFTAKGEPKTSVSAEAFENTRNGVKDSVRGILKGDELKKLDTEMSNLFALREAATTMDEKVQTLVNQIKERGLGEKIGRAAGKGINVATGGGLKGFFTSLITSNVGLKKMNSIEIQEMLAKNLKKLNKLTSPKATDKTIIEGINDFVQKAKTPVRRAGVVTAPIRQED